MSSAKEKLRFDLTGYARDGSLGDHDGLMRVAERADVLGFGGIWFNEFHFSRTTLPYPSTLLLGAAILARTQRLRFGTSILVLPLYHPLLLAEQIAQLDRQSGGRLDVGVGRGTSPETFHALGLDPAQAPARFAEALGVILAALTKPIVSSDGPTWTFSDVTVGPPPIQRPHPPIHVGAASPDTLAIAARHRFPLLLSLEPNETRQIGVFRDQLARAGASSEPLAASSLARYVIVEATQAKAEAALDRFTDALNKARIARANTFGKPPPAPRTPADMLAGYTIAGTPEACRAQIKHLTRSTGIRNMRCLFSANGTIPLDKASASMELFGTEVLPICADLPAPPLPNIRPKGTLP
ncbi:LLM class flavin-dependent oxidoreductase [Yoonia sp. MH D7]